MSTRIFTLFALPLLVLALLALPLLALAADLDIDTPEISALRSAMQQRFSELAPLLDAGAVGVAADGTLALRDPGALPLAQRSRAQALVNAENRDRMALYRAIAVANGHPEWAADVQRTFAARWLDRARAGWWVQAPGGWKQRQ